MATLYLEDGSVKPIEPKHPSKGFEFEGELYEILDCDMIQVVPFPDGTFLLMDEEGKLCGKEINHSATALWYTYYGNTDFVVGRAIHCTKKELK